MADMLALKDDTRRHARPSLHAPTALKIAQVITVVILHVAVHKSTDDTMGIIPDPWNDWINLLAAGPGGAVAMPVGKVALSTNRCQKADSQFSSGGHRWSR